MEQKSNDIQIGEAAAFLRESDGFVVYSHASPDGDTVGSAVALALILRSLGKRAKVFVCDKLPKKLSFIDTDGCISDSHDGETRISVDIASKPMLGAFSNDPDIMFDLSIDHHEYNTIPCRRRLLRAGYISCGEIIFELAAELGVKLDQKIAAALYAAISSDSCCFRYSATRPQTHLMAASLLETGIDFSLINRLLFEHKTPVQMELEKLAYNSIRLFLDGRFAAIEFSAAQLEALGTAESDMDTIHTIPRQIEGVEVSALIRHKPNEIKISLRSNDYFNVAAFASENFGGGGHQHAAGCRLPAGSTDDVGALIASKLEGLLK